MREVSGTVLRLADNVIVKIKTPYIQKHNIYFQMKRLKKLLPLFLIFVY
jgi:hypothetical protein